MFFSTNLSILLDIGLSSQSSESSQGNNIESELMLFMFTIIAQVCVINNIIL